MVIPTIEQSVADNLKRPISVAKLNTAISSLQSGKSPGPDGYSSEFYKKFGHKLPPLLLNMYESFDLSSLSSDPFSGLYLSPFQKGQRPVRLLFLPLYTCSKCSLQDILIIIDITFGIDPTACYLAQPERIHKKPALLLQPWTVI